MRLKRVKCCVTKEIGDASDFVKVGDKYYKNQEVYKQHETKRPAFAAQFQGH